MPCKGRKLSWCNGHKGLGRIWGRLDRVLANIDVMRLFPDIQMIYLPKTISDHCPMLVQFYKTMENYGPPPFRFQRMWTEHEFFIPCVEKAWNSNGIGEGLTGLYKLAIKLKTTKIALKIWNKQVFGRVEHRMSELEERVETLEAELQENISEVLEKEFMNSKSELLQWQQREEIHLSQQAKKKVAEGGKTILLSSFMQVLYRKGEAQG